MRKIYIAKLRAIDRDSVRSRKAETKSVKDIISRTGKCIGISAAESSGAIRSRYDQMISIPFKDKCVSSRHSVRKCHGVPPGGGKGGGTIYT